VRRTGSDATSGRSTQGCNVRCEQRLLCRLLSAWISIVCLLLLRCNDRVRGASAFETWKLDTTLWEKKQAEWSWPSSVPVPCMSVPVPVSGVALMPWMSRTCNIRKKTPEPPTYLTGNGRYHSGGTSRCVAARSPGGLMCPSSQRAPACDPDAYFNMTLSFSVICGVYPYLTLPESDPCEGPRGGYRCGCRHAAAGEDGR
jgi:hypothetical protein